MGAPRQHVTIPGPHRTVHGRLALPTAGRGPGVLVVGERPDLADRLADRLAAEGYAALVTDTEDGAELAAAVDHLLGHPASIGDAIGAIGLGTGGGAVLRLAAAEGDRIAAAVPFYGLPDDPGYDYPGLTAHVLGHYGEQDAALPAARVDDAAIRIGEATGRRPEIHFYPAGHAFMDENAPTAHDPLQAEIAWRRTLTFLWGHLG